jgi:hypothetical protein
MNSAHIYRPLVETAGSTLEHVGTAGIVRPEHYAKDARYLPGCFMSTEWLGERIKSNHPQVFRMLSEAECLHIDRASNERKRRGLWEVLSDTFDLQRQNYGGGQA